MMWALHWDIGRNLLSFRYGGPQGEDDRPLPWHLDLLCVYNHVEETMRQRTILPEEAGVLYRSKSAASPVGI